MTYYGAKELAASFRTVRGNTIQIADDIPENNYDFVPAEGARSVERLVAHIAFSYRFQHRVHAEEKRMTLEGIDFLSLIQQSAAEEAKSRTKAELIDLLKREGEVWACFVEGLSEEFLSEAVSMTPGSTPASKSRFEMILSVKEHEMHHRGQLMLIERMLDIVPHLTRQRQERIAQARTAKSSS